MSYKSDECHSGTSDTRSVITITAWEHGLIDAFPSRDAAAAFICNYVRGTAGRDLYATSERGEGYLA